MQNSNFIKTVENVLGVFNKYIPQEKQNSLYSKTLFSVTGRAVGNTVVSGRIAQVIAQRASFTVGVRGSALGNVLLSGGMIERSIYTSFRLQTYAPEVYNSLRRYDYDLLYFFLEPALQPFLEAIHIRHTFGQSAFNKIIDELDNELQKKRI
ncbi:MULTISPECIES: hypothetical protein [unclassified Enterobacter]|uniref:hypothetical protein n=1 Tax=unclassified Enterobacter TaxID=2608935 RepID=UPI00336BCD64